MTTAQDVIKAVAAVGREAAEGTLDPAALDEAVAVQCRELFGTVAGPDDPVWPVQLDVVRQVLALGGLSADELGEWAAVIRRRETPKDATAPSASLEPAGLPDTPGNADSSVSGPHSGEHGGLDGGDVLLSGE